MHVAGPRPPDGVLDDAIEPARQRPVAAVRRGYATTIMIAGRDVERASEHAAPQQVEPAALPRPSRSATLRHLARGRFTEYPAVYLPFARKRYPGPSPKVIDGDTELVIDGYMRSANTFAVYAFQMAQRRPVRLAHHLHAPAQVIEAVRRGVPTLVVVREPEGAILSQVQWEPDVSLSAALRTYARFYRCLLPYAARVTVGEFDEVTNDFGVVIDRLNARYGTSFDRFESTPENRQRCMDLMKHRASDDPAWYHAVLSFESGALSLNDLMARQPDDGEPAPRRRSGDALPADTWIPSADRKEVKRALRARYNAPEVAELRSRAESAYGAFLRAAGGTGVA
jgi:hypothetical protein